MKAPSNPRTGNVRWFAFGTAVLLVAAAAWLVIEQTRSSSPSAAWEVFQQLGTIEAADYHSLLFSPSDSNVLFFGHHNGIMQSGDGGRTWKAAVNRPDFDAMILAASPASPDVVWMAGHNVFFQSRDGGKTWAEARNDLPGLDLHAFAASPSDPNLLYAFAVGFGVFRSTDAGERWEPLGTAPPMTTALAVGGTSGTLYVGAEQGVMISHDQGQSFTVASRVGGGPVMALAAAPNSDIVYAGTSQGLYRSADGGQTWRKTEYEGQVAALAVPPTSPERVTLIDGKGRVFGRS
jgi:photosystem II stability/assembly factor-like uncharacterized protein